MDYAELAARAGLGQLGQCMEAIRHAALVRDLDARGTTRYDTPAYR